jgi:RNA polymerase sigma factor (sigma-70 family)
MSTKLAKVVHSMQRDAKSDADLLQSFVHCRDEDAFACLVKRHGPMVLAVARRILGNAHDAEDVFQATFLVLARRAACIKPPSMLGNWLHGVAYRTALEARRLIARRREKERAAVPRAVSESPDLAAIVDAELSCLPDKLRVALVLCELEGRTRREVARELGIAEGTVASRVARGRVLLAKRLARHGLIPSAALTASVPATVSASLLSKTVDVSMGNATGVVARLANGVLKAMLINRLRRTIGVVLLLVLSCVGLGQSSNPPNASGQSQPAKKQAKAVTELDRLQGPWKLVAVQENGKHVPKVDPVTWFIFGNKIAVKQKDREDLDSFRLDVKQNPKAIDIFNADGKLIGLGIYRWDGDKLQICGDQDQRPQRFSTQEGDNALVLTFQRDTAGLDAAYVARVKGTDEAVRAMQEATRKIENSEEAMKALDDIERAIQKIRRELQK